MTAATPPALPPQLRYVEDSMPGFARRLSRGKFVYIDLAGKPIRDELEIQRINKLAIPPAYQQVWICADPQGHIQATARDARKRKQYRYHPLWIEIRDAAKYERLLRFGQALPALRGRIDLHLGEAGLGRDKVMAAVVALLDRTLIRIGNSRYARDNKSFGLTTLRTRHVAVKGNNIRFEFKGKSGIEHSVRLSSPRLARILRRCLELPGQHLFQYLDEGAERRTVSSHDINDYLRSHAGEDFTAKDYRTWAGSALALEHLRKHRWQDEATAKKHLMEVIRQVSSELGNTPAICRKCYVHPAIIEAFLAGELQGLKKARKRKGLSAEEASLMHFLQALHVAPAG